MIRFCAPEPRVPGSRRPSTTAALVILALLAAVPVPALSQSIDLETSARPPRPVPAALEPMEPLTFPQSLGPVAPEALAMDGMGRLFVLDRAQGRILRLDRDGAWRPFGTGDQGGERYPNMTDLFAGWGPDLFALDPAASVLYQFDLDGHLKRSIGYGEMEADQGIGFLQPSDFALNRTGELLLLDEAGGRLLLFDRNGRFVTDLAAGTAGTERPQGPTRLVLSAQGRIFLLDPPAGRVRPFSRQGAAAPSWTYREGLEGRGSRRSLLGAVGERVVVASGSGGWVRLFSPEGKLLLHWANPGEPEGRVTDLQAAGDSLLYLASPADGKVHRWRWVWGKSGGPEGP